MLAVEITNTTRIWIEPNDNKTFPQGYVSRGIWSVGAFVRPLDTDSTDIAPTLKAASDILHRKTDLYSDFKPSGSSFIYPPSAALELIPLGWVVNAHSGDLSLGTKLVDLIGRICVLVTIIIALWFLRGMISGWKYWFTTAIIVGAFYPLRWMVTCVQVQSIITLFLAVAILIYARSNTLIAGLLVGLAACLKPHLVLLVLFSCFRKEWRFLVGMVVSGSTAILASFILIGFGPWQTYLLEIMPEMSVGYAYYPNQSINGIVHRWLGHPSAFVLGPPSEVVSIATKSAVLIFSLFAVLPRGIWLGGQNKSQTLTANRQDQSQREVTNDYVLRAMDIGIALLAITLASPIAWEHHFAWAIVLFTACLAAAQLSPFSSRLVSVLAVSYVLMGTYFLPAENVSSGWLSIINSPRFVGAIMLMISAWWVYVRTLRRFITTLT
jgi:hypothetical protein